jgi:hypothetical protein
MRQRKLSKADERLLRRYCELFAEQLPFRVPEWRPGQNADSVMKLVKAGLSRLIVDEKGDAIIGDQLLVDGEVVDEVLYKDPPRPD